jgi:hypothetical protein
MSGELNFNVQGGNIGGIRNVWQRERTKLILQGPNVWDGKNITSIHNGYNEI